MRKVLSVILTLAMLLSTVAFALPVAELDMAETAGEQQAVKEEASLLALPIVPGLNIYTGTEDVLTFDTETDKNNFSITVESGPYNSISIANIGTEEQPENVLVAHRAAYTGKSNWCGIGFSHTAFDGARKYRFKLSFKFNVATEDLTGYSYWGGFTSYKGSNDHKLWSGAHAFTNWVTETFDLTPKSGFTPNFRFRVGTGDNAGNCAELNTYLDNVAVIPFYKVTYTGLEDIYTLGENRSYTIDVNKKITDIPADKLGYEFIGWSTTENATETMTSVTLANEDITLYPVWKRGSGSSTVTYTKSVKPGLNMAGAVLAPWTFEGDMTTADMFTGSFTYAVVDNPVKDTVNDSDKVAAISLKNNSSTAYGATIFSLPEQISSRPVFVSFDYNKRYVATGTETFNNAANLWVMKNGGTYIAADVDNFVAGGAWKHYEKLINFSNAYNAGNSSQKDAGPIKDIRFHSKFNANPGTTYAYYDNILLVPSYQITYSTGVAGEDPAKVEHVLFDENNQLVTSYDIDTTVTLPDKYKFTFKGWSTDEAGTEPMTTVALANEDVVLYPVWEEDASIPDPQELKWDFETAESQTWSKRSYGTKYENGMMILDPGIKVSSGTSYINHANLTTGPNTDTKALRYLILSVRNTGTASGIRFYFRTSESDWSEANAFNVNFTETNSKNFKDYVVDMTKYAGWKGNYQNCMFQVAGSAGNLVEFEEIKFVTLLPEDPDPSANVNKYVWDFENNSGAGVSAWSGHTSTTYSDGKLVITRSNVGGSSGGIDFIPQSTLVAADYTQMLIKVLKTAGSDGLGFGIYFVTGNDSDIAEARKGNGTKLDIADNDYYYYLIDFSANSAYANGNIKKYVMTVGPAGTWQVEDVVLTNDYQAYINSNSSAPTIVKTYFNGAETIDTDKGTTVLSPYIRYSDGTEVEDFSDVYYITDSVCAKVVKNADGSATVTAQMNGTVNITAILPNGSKMTKTITITGQADRIAANSFNVVMFGNSIRSHGPSPSIGWPAEFNWGMAASSEEQDYAHRFIYHMNTKYGEGVAKLYSSPSIAELERAINGWQTDPSNEAIVKNAVKSFVSCVVENEADIISFQYGENASGAGYEDYYTVSKYMIGEVQKARPNAIIVVCTPFWSGSTDGKTVGAIQAANELGLPVALVHTLNKYENYAYGATWITPETIDGVKRHPGDKGMDEIAKLIYEQVNMILSANEKTVYTAVPASVTIDAPATEITTLKGTIQLSASVLPADASQDVVWSSSNDYIASVDKNGLVSAYNNGTAVIKAESRHKNGVFATVTINVSGQTSAHTVTYNKNTDEYVTNMPEPNPYAKEGFVFDKIYPVRPTYRFLGWALTPDATEADIITTYDVTEDITVYAVWESAYRWDFNRDGFKEEFTIDNGFNQYVLDGKFMSIATDTNVNTGAVLKVYSPAIMIDPTEYSALVIRMQNTAKQEDTKISLTFVTSDGEVTMTKNVVTTEPTEYEFLLDGITGSIMSFHFTPTNVDCTINLDHVEFVKQPLFTFDANAFTVNELQETVPDEVSGMPASIYFLENDVIKVPTNEPVRAGHTFLGWVTAADSKLIVETKTVPASLGKLYAAWDKHDHLEFDSADESGISGFGHTTDIVYKDGILSYTSTGDNLISTKGGWFVFPTASTSGILQAKMKWDTGTDKQTSQIFFTTNEGTSLAEGRSVSVSLPTAQPADYEIITYNFNNNAQWKGTLRSFRFDLLARAGKNSVDWIRFTDSEANIVTAAGDTRNLVTDDDWATFIVRKGGTLAPKGGILVKNLAISGDIDMSEGYIMASGKVEIAEDAGYEVYVMHIASLGVNEGDYVEISGCDVPVLAKNGAKYIVKAVDGVTFVKAGQKTYKCDVDNGGIAEELDYTPVKSNDEAVPEIRVSSEADKTGVRFKATVAHSMRNATKLLNGFAVAEYGYVASTGKKLASADKLTLKEVDTGNAVKGVAYKSDGTVDRIFSETDEGIIMSAVIVGVPNTKDAYETNLFIKPYIMLEGGLVIYGDATTATMLDLANSIKATMPADAPYATFINNIIDVCAG